MPSRRYGAKYGHTRFLSCRGPAETVSKFPNISGIAWKTRSPTPPKAAKVKLSEARRHGNVSPLTPGEIEMAQAIYQIPAAHSRAWEYWTARLARAGLMPPHGEAASPP